MVDYPTSKSILRALDWVYDQAVEGVGGVSSATRLGDEYLGHPAPLSAQVDRLVRWQVAKSCTSGFLTGLGGLAVLPLTLPASITSVTYVQLRMIAAVAHMGGHDVRSDPVRTLAYACLCGNAAKDIVKDVGVHLGKRLTRHAVSRISSGAIARVNERVGFRLLSKFGQSGVIHLGKAVPVVGGAVGAAFDGSATYAMGRIAKQTFIAPHRKADSGGAAVPRPTS